MRRKTGKRLLTLYKRRGILFPGVRDAHYFHGGTWYQQPSGLPCVYFDDDGYVVFETEDQFIACPSLNIGINMNLIPSRSGPSSVHGYRRIEPPPRAL